MDEYKRLRTSGALWGRIPAREYDERMAMLEECLLAQQPLGDDITITLEDEVFTYDGETGEGGYTPK